MNGKDPHLSLIVPAYNEARSILGTLAEMQVYLDRQSYSYEILVVADGTDGTRDLVRQHALKDQRVQVHGSAERGGKGRGVRLGVAHARGKLIGFVDADNKTPIEELDRVLPWFDHGYDMVIGSRALAESTVERSQRLYRQIGSRVFKLGMHLLVGLWSIQDTQCGFKFFRKTVAKDLFSRQRIDGYMFDVEILHLALQSGCLIKEVGVRWRDDGDSRLELVAGNWRNFVDLLRIRFGPQITSATEIWTAETPSSRAA